MSTRSNQPQLCAAAICRSTRSASAMAPLLRHVEQDGLAFCLDGRNRRVGEDDALDRYR